VSSRPILLATDFSAGADRALEIAVALARALGTSLSMVHVMDTAEDASDVVTPEIAVAAELLRARVQARVESARASLDLRARAIAGLAVETRVLDGRPAEALARFATTIDARMIVVGSHGTTRGLARAAHVVLGSTAERVIHAAHRPVLLVPSETPAMAIDRAPWIVAVADDDVAAHALDVAFDLAAALRHVPRAIHVVPSGELDERPETRRFDALVAAASRRHLGVGDDATTWVVRGRVAEVVTHFAKDLGGVLVLGTHAGGAVSRALGSTASRVVELAEMPLLLVPPAA
jgi:nucleotide-binding universal stress UspA family protein